MNWIAPYEIEIKSRSVGRRWRRVICVNDLLSFHAFAAALCVQNIMRQDAIADLLSPSIDTHSLVMVRVESSKSKQQEKEFEKIKGYDIARYRDTLEQRQGHRKIKHTIKDGKHFFLFFVFQFRHIFSFMFVYIYILACASCAFFRLISSYVSP